MQFILNANFFMGTSVKRMVAVIKIYRIPQNRHKK